MADQGQAHRVNFGLRWEVLPEFTENQGDIANFDPRNGTVVVPDILLNKTVPSSPLLQSNYNAFLVSFNAASWPKRGMDERRSDAKKRDQPISLYRWP
jgi:hypothetical protein